MKTEGNRPIWEEYEDFEEQFIPKGGSGGKERSSHSKTSKAAREESRENARANREDEARNRIFSVLRHFPKPDTDPQKFEFLDTYRTWLSESLAAEEVTLNPADVTVEFMRAKTKAGGQNVNKVNSAVRLTHSPTRISARSDDSRDQVRNREMAQHQLEQAIEGHLSDWKTILGDEKTLDPLQVKYFYIASHAL